MLNSEKKIVVSNIVNASAGDRLFVYYKNRGLLFLGLLSFKLSSRVERFCGSMYFLLPPQGFWPQRAKNSRRHLRTPHVT